MIRLKFHWQTESAPPAEWFDYDRGEKMDVNRRPFYVCAVWYKHPKNGRHFTVGKELLPDLPLNDARLEAAAKAAMTFGTNPPPDAVFFGYTSTYD